MHRKGIEVRTERRERRLGRGTAQVLAAPIPCVCDVVMLAVGDRRNRHGVDMGGGTKSLVRVSLCVAQCGAEGGRSRTKMGKHQDGAGSQQGEGGVCGAVVESRAIMKEGGHCSSRDAMKLGSFRRSVEKTMNHCS
jgi:hypothetical protein